MSQDFLKDEVEKLHDFLKEQTQNTREEVAGRRVVDRERDDLLNSIPLVYRKRLARWMMALVMAVGGIVVERTANVTNIVSGIQTEQQAAEERKQLIQDVKHMGTELDNLQTEVASNKRIDEDRWKEFMARFDRLEIRLERALRRP